MAVTAQRLVRGPRGGLAAVERTRRQREDWFYDYRSDEFFEGPALAPPDSHPPDQPVPGPAGAVPPDWQRHLN